VDRRSEVAWLARRAGWGLAPGELDELSQLDPVALVDRWIDPDAAGIAEPPDPWADITVSFDNPQEVFADGVAAWLRHLVSSPRPLIERMTWIWHDHFAVSARVVNFAGLMFDHLRLLRSHALGNFRDLLREVTTDPAMLVFLNGDTSTGADPNENYAREMMELFSVGVGNFTEDDVRAAAVALTGWQVRRRLGTSRFTPGSHDDSPQTLLGVTGVHDVDSVVDAVTSQPSCAPLVTAKLSAALLGPGVDPALITSLAAEFAAADLELAPLVRGILLAGLDGAGAATVLEPVSWAVNGLKATQAEVPDRGALGLLNAAGQLPMAPPNVGGFPPPPAYLSSSTTAARYTMASVMAATAPADNPARNAAAQGDVAGLADALGRPEGFGETTTAAIESLDAGSGPTAGAARLALALVSPEVVTS